MVTFSCDNCNDTIKKPKANQHAQRCRSSLTCIDCSKTFYSGEWNAHNSCISEAEAYQGALYKPTKKELKRKAAEAAAEAKMNGTVSTPNETVNAQTSTPVMKPAETTDGVEVPAKKKSKRGEDVKNVKDGKKEKLALLASVVPKDSSLSLYKALKLLKAQKKLDKDGEKALLKEICITHDGNGSLKLV